MSSQTNHILRVQTYQLNSSITTAKLISDYVSNQTNHLLRVETRQHLSRSTAYREKREEEKKREQRFLSREKRSLFSGNTSAKLNTDYYET